MFLHFKCRLGFSKHSIMEEDKKEYSSKASLDKSLEQFIWRMMLLSSLKIILYQVRHSVQYYETYCCSYIRDQVWHDSDDSKFLKFGGFTMENLNNHI